MSWLKFLVCFVIFGVIGYFAVEPVSTGSGYFGALLFAQLPVLGFIMLRGREGQEG